MSYAGYFVYQGKMNYLLALLTVFFSGGAGITITYWIGRAGGYKLIEKYGKYIHLGPEKYKKTAAWFERSGSKLLIFAYFIPGVRHFTGYISGISRLSFQKFIIPAYTGSFLWGFCFITLGKVLGPQWQAFHHAASKYFVMFIIVLAILLAVFLIYRFYKNQIKDLFIQVLKRLMLHLKTIRATEIFLICLALVLIGMVSFMMGLAQDYLANDFTEFNEVTNYMVNSVVYQSWMKGFFIFRSTYVLCFIIVLTILRIWRKGRNRALEYLLLLVTILGAKPFHDFITKALSFLESFGFVGKFHSENFPDLHAATIIIIYGVCFFLLVRHAKTGVAPVFAALLILFILIGLAITNIAIINVLPSDIVGGYVYGAVWIFFNFLLFEMLRLVLEKA
ncbi:DedA family protein [Neobacillus kokaensis]|nr:DedA family protein [Neobacillus kokaensis]